MYFRDPGSENSGLLDGIIDLGLVQMVSKNDSLRGQTARGLYKCRPVLEVSLEVQ